MTGFSLPENYTENPEKLVRRTRPRVIPPLAILPAQEPIPEAPVVQEAMGEKTLRDFFVPSTANMATGPNVNIGDMNFELKSSLITMVQVRPFCGKLLAFLSTITRKEVVRPIPRQRCHKCLLVCLNIHR